jgi:selenocysteine lyase/cysteine desulfurase
MLESLQEKLTKTLDMSVVFEEPDGLLLNVIGNRGNVCGACTKFIYVEGYGKRLCLEKDTEAASKAQGLLLGKKPSEASPILPVEFYVCNGRLRNFVIPISIGGEVIGNVFSGQFLVKPLARKDSDFHDILKKMAKLGQSEDFVLGYYAKTPEVADIPYIARDNNIPPEQETEFALEYEKMFQRAKTMRFVINAVYLLNEIAQSISLLGNAHYYIDTYNKLVNMLPEYLQLTLDYHLSHLGYLVQKIAVPRLTDTSKEVSEANSMIYYVLETVEKFEFEYIESLLIPFTKGVLQPNMKVRMLQKSLLAAQARYGARMLRTKLNKALRKNQLNPYVFTDEEKKLLAESNLELRSSEELLAFESSERLEKTEIGDLERTAENIRCVSHQLQDVLNEEEKIGLDEIECMIKLVSEENFGLQDIRRHLCEERVFDGLPQELKVVREQLRLNCDVVYMNWGSISPSFSFIARERDMWSHKVERQGPVSVHSEKILRGSNEEDDVLLSARKAVSKILNCNPDEVILTGNTTSGIMMALHSVQFSSTPEKNPDRIIATNLEYDSVLYCVNLVAHKFNVKPMILQLPKDSSEKDMVNEIARWCSDGKTKIVILSHLTYTGKQLDIANIIKNARNVLKEKSPLFLIDGAQAVGQLHIDVKSMDCDFYAADAHKWLMGPTGTGFLYVKEAYLEAHKGFFPLYENIRIAEKHRPVKNRETGEKYDTATITIEPYVGMRRAIEIYLDQEKKGQPTNQVKKIVMKLTSLIASELGSFGVLLVDKNPTSGIVSITVSKHDDFGFYEDVRTTLDKEYRVVFRALKGTQLVPHCLRFCISFLNTEWEAEYAVKALKKVLSEKHVPLRTESESVERMKLDATKPEIEEKIESHFEVAFEILSSKQTEAARKFSDYEWISRGKERAREVKDNLLLLKDNIIKKLNKATKVEELKSIEEEAQIGINQILETLKRAND